MGADRSGHSPESLVENLLHEHAPMLDVYLRSLVRRRSDMDDLFQETLLVAWRRRADYDRSRPFGAWLRGIARMLVLEHSRRNAAKPMTTNPQVLDALDSRFKDLFDTPGDTFARRADRLLDCLAHLPDKMREAISLVYARGLTIVAAAKSVGDSEESLKKRVQRGRRLLADCLEAGGAAQ